LPAPKDGRSGVKLSWTVEARQDRRESRPHFARETPAAALALDEILPAKAYSLIAHPALRRAGRLAGTHALIVHRNDILIYEIAEDSLRILPVLHARLQWPPGRCHGLGGGGGLR